MKKLFLLFSLAFMAMSCEQIQDFIDPKGHGLVFLEGEMKAYFDDKGDTKNYKFKADLAWSAEVSADWVEVDPTSGPAGENKIKIKVDKNKSDEKRTGYVDITLSNDKSYRIELEQLAAGENLDDVIQPTNSCPSNEIWYTSADGNIVEPYSGEGSQDNFAVFGANIVLNTYDSVKECWVIKFDGDVTTIGKYAFYYCISLTSVTIPDSVTTIGQYAFCQCHSLTSVTIPDSVTSIGFSAFSNCYSLTCITIPGSVTTIGEVAFSWCEGLTSVTIGDSVTTIEDGAFAACSSLIEFNGKFASDNGRCLIIDGTLTSFAPAGLTEYTIPNSVTTIGTSVFSWCEGLTSVTIGDSVTTIGECTFAYCSSLTEFNGKYASEDGRCLIIDGTLNSFAPAGLTEYTIPDSVTTIGRDAFYGCSSLTNVTINDSVTTIGEWAFGWCKSLTSVTIPDSVTTIGRDAFYNCSSLTSVYCRPATPPTADIYDSWCAFDENASDRKIYVPMESVDAYKSATGWSSYAYAIVGYDFGNDEVVVPDTDSSKHANNEIWYTSADGNIVEPCSSEFLDDVNILSVFGANIVSNAYDSEKECWIIKFDSDVITIGVGAFLDCSSLTSVTIPDSVTTIGDYAFCECDSLTSVTIPDSVTTIGQEAFVDCSSLTSVTIGDSVTTIGDAAFEFCSSLTSVTIPDSVTTIGDYAFYDCSSLTSVTIGDSVTTIGEGAFVVCDSLREFNGKYASEDGRCLIIDGTLNSFAIGCGVTEYTIPDSVTSIGDAAFAYCRSLTSVTIPDSVTTIGDCAFCSCSSLTSVTIGDSVTTIGDFAFASCSSLTSVTIPDSVTTIGYMAFAYCSSLTSVYCKAVTPPAVGYDMFYDNASGRKIYVPTESVEAYKSASGWSSYADAIVGYEF